jgi:hypothetical protein
MRERMMSVMGIKNSLFRRMLQTQRYQRKSARRVLDLLDRMCARSGMQSGAFDVLAWADGSVLFAEAKHGGKDTLRPSQKAWIEAALDEGVPLESLLVVEWGFSGVEAVGDYLGAGVHHGYSVPATGPGMPSPRDGMPATPPVNRTQVDA